MTRRAKPPTPLAELRAQLEQRLVDARQRKVPGRLTWENGMICTCYVGGIRDVEALYIDAMRRLGLARAEDVTLAVVLSLAFDFAADVTVDADQWFRVYLATPLKPSRPADVDCDHPADGLLFLWTELVAQFPERLTKSDAGTDADVLAAATASEARVKAHRSGNEVRDVCAAFWGAHVLDVTIDELFTGRHTGPSLVGRGLFTGAPSEGSP